ncbi:phosphoserine phosphatase SerB [Spiribacter sp. 1M153]|jgi:phosphoserine phosphatase|uniref:phosphoserine phosphatase SerB n=1 Tax=Spiribacter TaxID=1335745 RepID=UPI00132FA4D2|nr:phosphoserine phosphatase SerB [Spiribacter sp. SSL99]KAF0285392.1 phosphoserine phosphatase SerB [Spiribacter sp. SSL99]
MNDIESDSEIILINISGSDRPGVTAALMGILADYPVRVLDISQAMVHENLALAILIKLSGAADSAAVLKDLLYEAHQLELRVRFQPVPANEYQQWVRGERQSAYVLTLLGRRVTAAQIARIARVTTQHALNIEDIVRLSARSPLHDEREESRACLELSLRGEPSDADAMKAAFLSISREMDIDISFQEDNFYRRNRRLVVFDMDSTLIHEEVIDELAREAGVGDQVAAVTEAAMRGDIDFRDSLAQRVACLEGLDEAVLARVAERLTLTEGAERLMKTLQTLGYRTAVISGGFDFFGHHLQRRLDLDTVYANRLEIVDGRLTGQVAGPIVDGERKAQLLERLAGEMGIDLAQVIAVGDGANDLPMLRSAGLGIAFHAKPLVQKSARQAISTIGLDGVLYLMGMNDAENPH